MQVFPGNKYLAVTENIQILNRAYLQKHGEVEFRHDRIHILVAQSHITSEVLLHQQCGGGFLIVVDICILEELGLRGNVSRLASNPGQKVRNITEFIFLEAVMD